MDEKEKKFLEKGYTDHQGYYRWKDTQGLVHRSIAYNDIYKNNREKYPESFRDYQVHHKDGDKKNNRAENLELITLSEHEKNHGIVRREQLNIIYMKIMIFGFFGILGVEELSKRISVEGIGKALMFMGVFILILVLAIWFSREKEGVKYI